MWALFLLLLILVPPFISMLIEKKENGEPIVSDYDYTNDESDIGKIGENISRGMIGDMSSSYYILFDNDD